MSQKKAATISRTDRATAYAKAVLKGEIIAGPHVRNSCQRHIDDIKKAPDRGLIWDKVTSEWAIGFFEKVLKLSDGQFEGKPFLLHPSQCFIVGSLFGWLQHDGRRRFRRAFIEQGKGNGKSPLAAGLGLIGLTSCDEASSQVYSAAAKREQASILFQDACKMVRKSPALSKRCKISGPIGKEHNISHYASASFFRPVSRDHGRTGSGPRPYFILADEIHEMPSREILETLERGFKSRREPLLFMITNSGSDRNSVAWEEHEHACKVAAGSIEPLGSDSKYVGDIVDDTTFSYVCALDEGDDPLEDDNCWIKANPLLGHILEHEYLAQIVKQAVAMPGKLNTILRLHFCVWTDADVSWMQRKLLEPAIADFKPAELHEGKKICVGMDLSENRDITAICSIVKTGFKKISVTDKETGEQKSINKPTFDAWIEAWTPGDTLAARSISDKIPYDVWRDKGYINAPPGSNINYLHVGQSIVELDRIHEIQLLAYDRFAYRRFEQDCEDLGLSKLEFIEHPQGGMKKGKPSSSMIAAAKRRKRTKKDDGLTDGLWMPGSLRLLEDALLEGRLRLLRNPVLISAILSAVKEEDKWGNGWLSKIRSTNKIDAAVALCMAIGASMSVDTGKSSMKGWLDHIENDENI